MSGVDQSRERWKYRRRVVFATLVYIAAALAYLIVRGADTALNQQIALALVGAGTAVIGSYVFGAVWDDKLQKREGA